MTQSQLTEQLHTVSNVFDIDKVLQQGISDEEIMDYYAQTDYLYRLFYSTDGSVHMALNYDGNYRKDGCYEQARTIDQHLADVQGKKVLELGSGKGFNSIYLAKRNPEVQFTGVDLTPKHVKAAQDKAKSLPNLEFRIEDFQSLEMESQLFDLAFEVECITHASDMDLALSETYRVLKPGGRFIVFDGFRKARSADLETDLKTAMELVEVTMAVKACWFIDDWLDVAKKAGFSLIEVEDISHAIMPTLMRFYKIANAYFKYPRLAKAILRVLPERLGQVSIAGLLMPATIEAEGQGYFKIVLERK